MITTEEGMVLPPAVIMVESMITAGVGWVSVAG